MTSPSISVCSQLRRCSTVGKHEGLVLANSSGWNRWIGVAQSFEWSGLVGPGDQPKNAPRTIDYRIGQRHPTPALINSGQGNICVIHLKDRISRYERGGVAVRPEP